MPLRRELAALFFVLGLSACGGKSFDDSGAPNGGTDAGGTDAGGTESGGNGGVAGTQAGGTATGGTGSGGGEAECRSFNDEAALEVVVEIRNETFSPIHLGPGTQTCAYVPLFSVADAAGKSLPHLSSCRFSCQALLEQGVTGCGPVCLGWEAITLQPGESLFEVWDGRYSAGAMLPGRCVPGEEPNRELMCHQAKVIRAGAFTFTAEAGTDLECALSSMCPSCRPDANGGCRTTGALITGKLLQAATKVELAPRYGALELPAMPGPAPEPLPPLTVTLVFTD